MPEDNPNIFNIISNQQQLNAASLNITELRPSYFENGCNLTDIDLTFNKIEVIPKSVFVSLSSLVFLTLSFNKIQIIEDHALEGLLELEVLHLFNNKIKTLTKFAVTDATNLEKLAMPGNQLETIEEGALNLPKLTDLYVENNRIKTLPSDLCISLPKLSTIYLESNLVSHIGQAFEKCDKLEILYLNDNIIQDVDIKSFARMKKLKGLILSHNNFTLPTEEANSSPSVNSSLIELTLIQNRLSDPSDPSIFRKLAMFNNLKYIFLQANEFTHLEHAEEIAQLMPQLRSINVHNNTRMAKWIKENVGTFQRFNITLLDTEFPYPDWYVPGSW